MFDIPIFNGIKHPIFQSNSVTQKILNWISTTSWKLGSKEVCGQARIILTSSQIGLEWVN